MMTASLKIEMQTIQKVDETYDVYYISLCHSNNRGCRIHHPSRALDLGCANLTQNASSAVYIMILEKMLVWLLSPSWYSSVGDLAS